MIKKTYKVWCGKNITDSELCKENSKGIIKYWWCRGGYWHPYWESELIKNRNNVIISLRKYWIRKYWMNRWFSIEKPQIKQILVKNLYILPVDIINIIVQFLPYPYSRKSSYI